MALPDRGYTNLLTHLNQPSTNVPLTTIQASLAHYLAHLKPYPTPLAATAIGSPLFRPFAHGTLQALTNAFRHAVHIKHKALADDPGGLFTRGLRTRLRAWAAAVLTGVQRGDPVARLACCGGLLLGIQDFEARLSLGRGGVRGKVEDEVVVALAEVMDVYVNRQGAGEWEKEFQPAVEEKGSEVLSMLERSLTSQCSGCNFIVPHLGLAVISSCVPQQDEGASAACELLYHLSCLHFTILSRAWWCF